MMGFYTDSHTGAVPEAVWELLSFAALRDFGASHSNFTNPPGPCCAGGSSHSWSARSALAARVA
jgi:hypothetical protein